MRSTASIATPPKSCEHFEKRRIYKPSHLLGSKKKQGRSGAIKPSRQIEIVVKVFAGRRVFRVIDEQRYVQLVQGSMRAQPAREVHALHIHFSEHCVLVAPHHQIPDPGLHQFVVARRLISSNDALDSLKPRNNLAHPPCIVRVLEIYIGPTAAASMLLPVAVAPHGKSFSQRNSPPIAHFL